MRFLKQSKKFLVSIMCIFVMLLVVGCSSGKGANKKTYTMEKDGGNIEVVIGHKENEIISIELNAKVPIRSNGINKEQDDLAKDILSDFSAELKMLKGIEISANAKDGNSNFSLKIDYSKVDIEKLKKLLALGAMSGGMPSSNFNELSKNLDEVKDLSKIETLLKLGGFTEKK